MKQVSVAYDGRTEEDWRDLVTEYLPRAGSWRGFVVMIGSKTSYGTWNSWHNGRGRLSLAMKRELLAFLDRPDEIPAGTVGDAVRPWEDTQLDAFYVGQEDGVPPNKLALYWPSAKIRVVEGATDPVRRRKQPKRVHICLYDRSLYARINSQRKRLGLTWEEWLHNAWLAVGDTHGKRE